MKIAIISDSKENSGGSIHVTLSAAKSLQNLNISNLDLDFVVTQKSIYEKLKNQYNNKIKLLDENTFFFKISSFLYRNFFFKKIYHKFLLDNYNWYADTLLEWVLKKTNMILFFL